MIIGARRRDFRAKIFSAISIWSSELSRSPVKRSVRRRRLRSLGCWHKATTSCQFPAQIGALDVDLSSADLARIDQVAPREAFAGARYPEWAMGMVNR